MLQAQEGTELGLPWLPSTWELPSREAQDPGGPPPPSSLGVGPVLGHGRLRGHQEEDVGFQVHHGLLLGLLGRVLGPGRGVHVKGDVGTSGPLDDGESADQLVEVLPVGTKPTLDSAPSARKWASAPLCSRKPWTTPPHHPCGAVFLILLLEPPPAALGHHPCAPCLLRDGLFVLVDGWQVDGGKQVTVHVVGARQVVDVGGVGVQVDRVIGDKVPIDNRDEAQIVHHGDWGAEQQVLAPSGTRPPISSSSARSRLHPDGATRGDLPCLTEAGVARLRLS